MSELSVNVTAKAARNSDEDCYESIGSNWWAIPEPLLLIIFHNLTVKEIFKASAVCKRWHAISHDNILWKHKFQEQFKTASNISLKPGAESWRAEYKRLKMNIPFVLTQSLNAHVHQVLHVSFAHNGTMFATCSKDGYVIIWNANHPCTEKYSHNMKQFAWKYTQYSQFNQSDTLLLVSGVHFGTPHSTSGEIAVFSVDENEKSYLRCRVVNRPYDIFGTWFSDQYLISGDLHWLAHLVSTSVLWLNKANQETDSEHVPVMNQLYKFYNKNASSVRALMVAKCPWLDATNDPLPEVPKATAGTAAKTTNELTSNANSAGNPLSHAASLSQHRHSEISPDDYLLDIREQSSSTNNRVYKDIGAHKSIVSHIAIERDASVDTATAAETIDGINTGGTTIHYLDEYRREYKVGEHESDILTDDDDEESMDINEEYDDMENNIPRYLIFSTGSKTYTPHQIGIKRIRNVYFPKKLDPGPSLRERIAARREAERQNQYRDEPDWWNYPAVEDRFDKVDKVIDLHGHIIGMALSPDHRYLYVNTRPWPKNYFISNALEPPPIAQEIDIHVIDLMTLKRVGNMLHAHKAYTPSNECFFIFLDVCDDYVASGAEDQHAYLWDRYYGFSLAKFRHADVVNSVAFNPRDQEMLVTTSDDYTIKIWRSRAKVRDYNIESFNTSESFDLKAD